MRILRPFTRFTQKLIFVPEEEQILLPHTSIRTQHANISTSALLKYASAAGTDWFVLALETEYAIAGGRKIPFMRQLKYYHTVETTRSIMFDCYIQAADNVELMRLIAPFIINGETADILCVA